MKKKTISQIDLLFTIYLHNTVTKLFISVHYYNLFSLNVIYFMCIITQYLYPLYIYTLNRFVNNIYVTIKIYLLALQFVCIDLLFIKLRYIMHY